MILVYLVNQGFLVCLAYQVILDWAAVGNLGTKVGIQGILVSLVSQEILEFLVNLEILKFQVANLENKKMKNIIGKSNFFPIMISGYLPDVRTIKFKSKLLNLVCLNICFNFGLKMWILQIENTISTMGIVYHLSSAQD